jgi:hybrid polyketide synthase/nonribosomal peptide synthetase ACE1
VMRSLTNPGFGGTNAHAILEHYEPQPPPIPEPSSSQSPRSLTPFVFSAASETALVAQLRAYSAHLKQHVALDGAHLAWTLHRRRSALSTKAAFAAASLDQLASTIDAALAEAQKANTPVGHRANASSMPRLLGVFTGQGAQWPAMGAHLIRASPFASDRIAQLEDSLATLPVADRPAWSLHAEMLAADDVSRIAEAALSQPLCTAIQVVLVDLLRAAGIVFTAVVGHSSGEIAAAYAAGFVTASDAIRIAYYRGLYARFAGNESNGQKGAMLAAGTSWEDAQQLVNSPPFKGRLAIAAHNSPASVTLSGDADAVAEAKKHFDQEKKFARLLKVDTAYHSHHMLPVGDRYVEALQACGIQPIRERDGSCSWYSSVTASVERMDDLQNEYWRDNMTNAVLFADAVKNAVAGTEHIDLAIEVGPHPALKGPAMQNVSEVQDTSLPYCGVLSRGKDDVEAFSQALGFLWTRLPQLVDLPSLEKAFLGETWHPKLMLDLPSYQWNHGRVHWAESRISKRMRTRKHAHHEVLGFLSPDSNAHDMRWSNVLKLKEIPWLNGHQLQGQTVFPAAGYVAMALEASRTLAGDKPVELFELHQLHIPRAITFDEADDSGVETLVTLTGIERLQASVVTAAFACYSTPVVNAGSENDMELSASGTVKIDLGAPDVATLPCALIQDHNMTTADADHFYASIAEIGYNYSGSFRTLSSAKRKLNCSSVFVESYAYDETTVSEYLVHPSMLDVAFQASFLAYSAPGDGRLWTLSVPTSIGTIRVNPELCAALLRAQKYPFARPSTATLKPCLQVLISSTKVLPTAWCRLKIL